MHCSICFGLSSGYSLLFSQADNIRRMIAIVSPVAIRLPYKVTGRLFPPHVCIQFHSQQSPLLSFLQASA